MQRSSIGASRPTQAMRHRLVTIQRPFHLSVAKRLKRLALRPLRTVAQKLVTRIDW